MKNNLNFYGLSIDYKKNKVSRIKGYFGALTNSLSQFRYRGWDNKQYLFFDTTSAEMVEIVLNYKYSTLFRVIPGSNRWITDRTRFSLVFLFGGLIAGVERLISPKILSPFSSTFTSSLRGWYEVIQMFIFLFRIFRFNQLRQIINSRNGGGLGTIISKEESKQSKNKFSSVVKLWLGGQSDLKVSFITFRSLGKILYTSLQGFKSPLDTWSIEGRVIPSSLFSRFPYHYSNNTLPIIPTFFNSQLLRLIGWDDRVDKLSIYPFLHNLFNLNRFSLGSVGSSDSNSGKNFSFLSKLVYGNCGEIVYRWLALPSILFPTCPVIFLGGALQIEIGIGEDGRRIDSGSRGSGMRGGRGSIRLIPVSHYFSSNSPHCFTASLCIILPVLHILEREFCFLSLYGERKFQNSAMVRFNQPSADRKSVSHVFLTLLLLVRRFRGLSVSVAELLLLYFEDGKRKQVNKHSSKE